MKIYETILQEQYPLELNDLKRAYENGELNLFLGAGISVASGLPTWKQLVVSMYFRYMNLEQWTSIKPYPNYLYAIGEWYLNKTGESLDIIIRKLKSNLSDQEFLKILYNCLYNQLDESYFENPYNNGSNSLLKEITNLIASPRRKVKSVVTYNFDDLLEQSLKAKGEDFSSVFSTDAPFAGASLTIYHPHGFIPFDNQNPNETFTGKIILSEDDYNSVANTNNYWANIVQTSILTRGTGLMIGLSFSDRNLRRLIDQIASIPLNTNNYIFLKRNLMPELTIDDSEEIKVKADSIANKMVRAGIKMSNTAFNNSTSILSELYRQDEVITNLVFEKMKIKPIWFSEYDEVVDFVRAIKN